MKYFVLALFILILTEAYGQYQYGYNVYKDDSLKTEVYRDGDLIRTRGNYENGQLKYTRIIKGDYVVDTVEYFSDNGQLQSKVDYKNLRYEISDSSLIENYSFIDSCLNKVKSIIDHSFPSSFTENYLFLNGQYSRQNSPLFDGYRSCSTMLYEPINYPMSSCTIQYSAKSEKNVGNPYLSFKIDSSFKIVQSSIDTNKIYEFNYDLDYANKILAEYGWKEFRSEKQKRGITISGPRLFIGRTKMMWIIDRQAGKILPEGSFLEMSPDDYTESIRIDIETGAYQKNLHFTGVIE